MSGKQERNGKAFEYAIVYEFATYLKGNDNSITVSQDAAFNNTMAKFNSLSDGDQNSMVCDAKLAIQHILKLEPKILHDKGIIHISIQPDSKGSGGDVRDILMIRSESGWEIGISAKNNSFFEKSARLSHKTDYFEKNFQIQSSQKYKDNISKILKILDNKKGDLWKDFSTKEDDVYYPVLQSFVEEITSLLNGNNKTIANNFMTGFLGNKDYYKIVRNTEGVRVQALNISGTINLPTLDGMFPEIAVGKCPAPANITDCKIKVSDNTSKMRNEIIVSFDNGLVIEARIHSKDKKISKTGLALEIKMTRYPTNYYSHLITR